MTVLSTASEELLASLAVTKAKNTVDAYRRDLAAYEEFLSGRGVAVEDVDESVVQDYLAFLRAAGRKPASIRRALAAIRSLHRFGVDELRFSTDPTAAVRAPKVPDALPKALSEEEVDRLLSAVVGNDGRARRDQAILELLYGTGMRISELVTLSLSDLSSLDQGFLRVFGKGSKERVVPVGRCARDALSQWLSPAGRESMAPDRWVRKDDAEAVFLNARGRRLTRQGAWLILRKHGERVGLRDRLWPHVLRHSCATHMLEHGADVRVVQELLGHASIGTTQVYTRLSTDHVRQVYEQAHPRARIRPPTGERNRTFSN